MSLLYTPEIIGGVLTTRHGAVHRRWGARTAKCGQSIPDRHAPVSHVQAIVHKLRLCDTCFPAHVQAGGRKPVTSC